MTIFLIAGGFLALAAVVISVTAVVMGAQAEARFDEHVQDDLDLIAADDRNARLDANANGTGWY